MKIVIMNFHEKIRKSSVTFLSKIKAMKDIYQSLETSQF